MNHLSAQYSFAKSYTNAKQPNSWHERSRRFGNGGRETKRVIEAGCVRQPMAIYSDSQG